MTENENEQRACELCRSQHPIEDMTPTVDGCDLCPSCQAAAEKAFKECDHHWTADVDEFGEPVQFCDRCNHIVADGVFPALFGVPAPSAATEARTYIALFRKHTLPGADHVDTETRRIWLDRMTDEDAVFVAAEFKRMETQAAKEISRQ